MLEAGKPEKCNVNTNSIQNLNNIDNPSVINNDNSKINLFLQGPGQEADKRACAEITQKLHKEFNNVFAGIGCFDGTFFLQTRLRIKPYPAPQACSMCITKAI